MEPTIRSLRDNVKRMVAKGILRVDYEVNYESYICFTYRNAQGISMYYTGKVIQFPIDLQDVLVGAFLNETVGAYTISGIYEIAQGY